MSRARDLVRLPPVRTASPAEVEAIVDLLQQVVGRATSLVVVPLVHDAAGVVVAASVAPGTRVDGSGTALDLADAYLQQWRLVAEASATAGAVLALRDVTAGRVLASVSLPGGMGVVPGAWTTAPVVAPPEHVLELRVIGSGSVTLRSVALQARTVVAPPR